MFTRVRRGRMERVMGYARAGARKAIMVGLIAVMATAFGVSPLIISGCTNQAHQSAITQEDVDSTRRAKAEAKDLATEKTSEERISSYTALDTSTPFYQRIKTTKRYVEIRGVPAACTKEFFDELTGFYNDAKALSESNDLKKLKYAADNLVGIIWSIPFRPQLIREDELLKETRELLNQINDKRLDLMNKDIKTPEN